MSEIKANNININYQLKGEGKTIVFVHGLSDNLHYWDILTNELASRYQVLTYDLRGHGSSGDDDRQSSIDLYQEDLYCLLNELNIDNAVFISRYMIDYYVINIDFVRQNVYFYACSR